MAWTQALLDRLPLTRFRVYLFILSNAVFVVLVARMWGTFCAGRIKFLPETAAMVAGIFCYIGALRWLADVEPFPDGKRSGHGVDSVMRRRFLLGHGVLILAYIYGVGATRTVILENYGISSGGQGVVDFLFFVAIYAATFFLTFIKHEAMDIGSFLPIRQVTESVVSASSRPSALPQATTVTTDVFALIVENPSVRTAAFDILKKMPEASKIFPSDELYQKKGVAFFQQAIIRALGDARDPAAVPFLAALLGKTYNLDHGVEAFHRPHWPNIGVDAAAAMARIGMPSADALVTAMGSADRLVRLYAVYGIALLRAVPLRSAVLDARSKETDEIVLAYIDRTLAQFDGKEYVPESFRGLEVIVEPALTRSRLGEPVRFFWTVKNNGAAPLLINADFVKVSKHIFHVRVLKDTALAPVPYDSDSAPSREDIVVLAVGGTHRSEPFDLRESFDFSQPGRYEVAGIYRNHFSGVEYGVYIPEGKCVSAPVTIEIARY